jgi:hypothetical protein
LRGYATAAREKSASKLSYFFDVTDKAGKKVNRIAGEEVLAAAPAGKDVWQGVTPQISKAVAAKTAQSLSAFHPGATGGPAIASAPAAGGAPTALKAAASGADAAAARQGTTTGSIDRQAATATMVPTVTGAPGDGSQSLTAAIQKELGRNGVSLAQGGAGGLSYKVEGRVVVGANQDGKQPIQIDWDVKDPQGKKLGTVSQKNDIPQGSLDGAWGKTADAAAAAAAQGIIKLLPSTTKTTQ